MCAAHLAADTAHTHPAPNISNGYHARGGDRRPGALRWIKVSEVFERILQTGNANSSGDYVAAQLLNHRITGCA